MNKKINLIIGVVFLLLAVILLFLDVYYLITIGVGLVGFVLLFLSLKEGKNLPISVKKPSLPIKTEEEPEQPSSIKSTENVLPESEETEKVGEGDEYKNKEQ